MSELDFDELDKAVNTLMGDVPRVEPAKTDDVKTLNINSTLSDASRPSLAELDSALSQVNGAPVVTPAAAATLVVATPSTPVGPTTPPLAARRAGRFMDVVHPSSDMKGISKPNLSGARQGLTIEPTNRVTEDDEQPTPVDTATPAPTEEMTSYESSHVFTPAPEVSDAPKHESTNDWPDPLDMPGYEAETDVQDVAEVEEVSDTPAVELNADEPSVRDEVDTEADDDALFNIDDINGTDDDEPQPLNSPFLADAKVEKRPLGVAQTDDASGELGHAPVLGVLVDQAADETAAEDQLPASPRDATPPLPPELQSDLMAIEADSDTIAAVSTPVVAAAEQKNEAPTAEPVVAPAVQPEAEAAPVSTGPTSIPQQYQEAQSTGDQPAGSIYDTESYHQPLAHPAKAKSGWLWIIWILLLLIVGGGGAVALYFLGII